jgi:hypothetical protein
VDADGAVVVRVADHRACGFETLGVMRSVGWKFDRWLDVVMMQRALGAGDNLAPTTPLPGAST